MNKASVFKFVDLDTIYVKLFMLVMAEKSNCHNSKLKYLSIESYYNNCGEI